MAGGAHGYEETGGVGGGCGTWQLHPGGGGPGLYPVRHDPHDEQPGAGHRLSGAAAGPGRCAADSGGGAHLSPDSPGAVRFPGPGPGGRPDQFPQGGHHPGGRLFQHRHALAAGGDPAVPPDPPGADGGYPDGQRGGGIPLGPGGQGGHGLCQPPGRDDHGLAPPGGGPAAGHPAAGVRPGRPGAVRRAGFQQPRVSDALHGLPPGHSPGFEPLRRHAGDPHHPGVRQRHHLHGGARPGGQRPVGAGAQGTPCRRCPWTRRPSGSWASSPGTAGSCGPPPGASSPRPGTSFARSNRRSLC